MQSKQRIGHEEFARTAQLLREYAAELREDSRWLREQADRLRAEVPKHLIHSDLPPAPGWKAVRTTRDREVA